MVPLQEVYASVIFNCLSSRVRLFHQSFLISWEPFQSDIVEFQIDEELDCEQARLPAAVRDRRGRQTRHERAAKSCLDCEHSLFSSKMRGEQLKTTTSGSRHRRSHITLTVTLASLFCVLPHGFSRDCSQSNEELNPTLVQTLLHTVKI